MTPPKPRLLKSMEFERNDRWDEELQLPEALRSSEADETSYPHPEGEQDKRNEDETEES